MPENQPSLRSRSLAERYQVVRQNTMELACNLSDADATVQSMEDASPAKWHLAHTTWFFETLILKPHSADYQVFDPAYNYLFNSYYDAIGERHPRPQRGILTRPTLEEVYQYRIYVDQRIDELLEKTCTEEILRLLELGLNHEQQHQELFLTDILHLFAQNPLKPAFKAPEPIEVKNQSVDSLQWQPFTGGVVEVGHDGEGFAFDCEAPQHKVYVEDFALADRAITNAEWRAFMADGGYENPQLWLSDGWQIVQEEGWQAPLYWQFSDDAWQVMTLRGLQAIEETAPVTHVSFYEADAYARWAGFRLPSEHEWELAARTCEMSGNFLSSGRLRPAVQTGDGVRGLFGDVWEWTSSPFIPYPNFKPAQGAVGEYNGKFMSGQMVLRGGSCVTPAGHIRPTYRNFFHPQKRWQFSGVRLAKDC